MTRGILTSLAVIAAGVLTLSVLGCRRGSEESSLKSGFEEFVPVYNRYIEKWVKAQQSATDEEAEKTRGGIIIPDSAKERPLEGKVIAVGSGKRLEDGTLVKLDVKAGDRVLFGKYAGTEIKVDGVEHIIIREDEVLGVIEG